MIRTLQWREARPPRWAALAGTAVLAGVVAGALVSAVNPLYALLGILALGVCVGAVALPTGRFWLLAAVITLLPFATMPLRLGVQPTMLDALLALLLIVALMRFLGRVQPGVSTPLDLPIVIYLALCTVSFVFGAAYGVNGETVRYFLKLVAAILLFFALTNGLTSRRMLASFVNALIAGSFGSALLAVVLYAAGQETAARTLSALGPLGYPTGVEDTLRFIAGTTIWRATSTSVDPNIFGGLLMIGLLLLLGRLLGKQGLLSSEPLPSGRGSRAHIRAWLLAAPLLVVMAWALLLSYSRGAWVGLAAGVAFLVMMRYRRAFPFVALAGVVAVIALGNTDFGQHLVSGFLIEDKASAMRIGEYKDALSFIAAYPLFGVGFGTTPTGTSAITPQIDIYVGVSNIYLLMALEIGLVGVTAFAVVVTTLALWVRRRYREADADGQAWMATASAALFAAGVAGIADHYFFRFPHMVALFWSLLAILAISARLSRKSSSPLIE